MNLVINGTGHYPRESNVMTCSWPNIDAPRTRKLKLVSLFPSLSTSSDVNSLTWIQTLCCSQYEPVTWQQLTMILMDYVVVIQWVTTEPQEISHWQISIRFLSLSLLKTKTDPLDPETSQRTWLCSKAWRRTGVDEKRWTGALWDSDPLEALHCLLANWTPGWWTSMEKNELGMLGKEKSWEDWYLLFFSQRNGIHTYITLHYITLHYIT